MMVAAARTSPRLWVTIVSRVDSELVTKKTLGWYSIIPRLQWGKLSKVEDELGMLNGGPGRVQSVEKASEFRPMGLSVPNWNDVLNSEWEHGKGTWKGNMEWEHGAFDQLRVKCGYCRILGASFPMPISIKSTYTVQPELETDVYWFGEALAGRIGIRGSTSIRQRRCHGFCIRIQVNTQASCVQHAPMCMSAASSRLTRNDLHVLEIHVVVSTGLSWLQVTKFVPPPHF